MRIRIETIIERRIYSILPFFFLAMAILIARLFSFQILEHDQYVKIAARQHEFPSKNMTARGQILAQDKNGGIVPLAFNTQWNTLVVSPKDIEDIDGVANIISSSFQLEEKEVRAKLEKKGDPHEVVLKKIDPAVAKEFTKKKLKGVFFEEEKRRVYPYGRLASSFLGFVSIENRYESGRYGLERWYQDDLEKQERDVPDGGINNFLIGIGKKIMSPRSGGGNLLLTVDYNIQVKAEEALHAMIEKWQASLGLVLVVDPMTGKVIAEAVHPGYDPNEYSKEKDFKVFLNPALESMYELGSVMKPIIMAAGLEEHVITPETTYYDKGELHFGTYTIKNFDSNAYHTQTMTQVLEKSLNTGIVFVAKRLGEERQISYLKRFGFGEKTNIDLPGEIRGNISNLVSGRSIDFATASFGQGIAVTPLQLAMAMSAVANGGHLMKPFVVSSVIDDSGNVMVQHIPEVVRQVVSAQTSETLTKMLVSTVRNGFENRAGVKGYFVAGKTGTAQIPKSDGHGYSDKVIHTFVGYAPAFQPRFLALLLLYDPHGNRFSANTLTPVFHDLAEYILNYYEVPPDEK